LKKSYEESLDKALRRITEHVPEDLVRKFAQESGINREDIHPIPPGRSGMVTAVDGSNTMVLEGGSVAIAAIRAVQTTFLNSERHNRSITPLTLVTIGPGHRNRDFDELYQDCFGIPPHKGLDNADPERASAILRDTLEYWVALQAVRTLPEGALLLLDGALRVSSQNHEPVLAEIITTAQERNVLLAAIAKRTRVTWGGGHPLLPAMGGLAAHLGISGPWWAKVDEHLPDHTEYRQGRYGELYIASLHSRVSRPMKIDLPKGNGEETAAATMQALAACADDGRIPGYPYPLLDAHRTCLIDEPLVTQIQQDIIAGLAKQGMQNKAFEDLFGDLHGEFERY
jgi:hypothetical protein